MKKIYSCLTLSLSLCFATLTSFAVPAEEGAVMVSQLEAADFITMAGLAFLLLGLLFVLLSVYAGMKKKDRSIEYSDEIEYNEPAPALDTAEPIEKTEEEIVPDNETVEVEEEPTPYSDDVEPEIDIQPEEEPEIEEETVPETKIRITLTGTNNPDVRFAEFTDRCTLGRRNTNDIMISDNAVSGNHCEFIAEEDKIIIRDLNSTNGTLLNGEVITAEEIKTGDLIIVGKLQYRVSVSR